MSNPRSPRSSSATAASCRCTATGCSARFEDAEDLVQETLPARLARPRELRRRRALLAARVALPDRDERVPRRAAQPAAADPAAATWRAPRGPDARRPRRRPTCRGCSRTPTGCSSRSPRRGRAGRGRRRARDDRARLPRRHPAPAAAPAGGADPARRARLVGRRTRRRCSTRASCR